MCLQELKHKFELLKNIDIKFNLLHICRINIFKFQHYHITLHLKVISFLNMSNFNKFARFHLNFELSKKKKSLLDYLNGTFNLISSWQSC